MISPEWSIPNIVLYLVFTFLAVGMGAGEWMGSTLLKYSNFRPEKGIDNFPKNRKALIPFLV